MLDVENVERVPGAEYALLFKRIAQVNHHVIGIADRMAKLIGPTLNWVGGAACKGKQRVKVML